MVRDWFGLVGSVLEGRQRGSCGCCGLCLWGMLGVLWCVVTTVTAHNCMQNDDQPWQVSVLVRPFLADFFLFVSIMATFLTFDKRKRRLWVFFSCSQEQEEKAPHSSEGHWALLSNFFTSYPLLQAALLLGKDRIPAWKPSGKVFENLCDVLVIFSNEKKNTKA